MDKREDTLNTLLVKFDYTARALDMLLGKVDDYLIKLERITAIQEIHIQEIKNLRNEKASRRELGIASGVGLAVISVLGALLGFFK